MDTIKKIIIITLTLTIYSIVCNQIYIKTQQGMKVQNEKEVIERKKDSEIIGTLIIPKLNIKQDLYQKNSTHNNIEEHVTILPESKMPDEQNSIIFLAAHSGTGNKAYFNNLDHLNINDTIILSYQNQNLKYTVKDIWEENKNGYIHVNKELSNQLILTTCSPAKKNKQLIINSIKKET